VPDSEHGTRCDDPAFWIRCPQRIQAFRTKTRLGWRFQSLYDEFSMTLQAALSFAPRKLVRTTRAIRKFVCATRAMRNQQIQTTREHLGMCVEWLLYSQKASRSDGYAATDSVKRGWQHAYIETTGYIIPTMLDAGAFLGDARGRKSALRAGEWLLTVQLADGSFTDIDEFKPQVFDTGQVLLGLNRLYRETRDARYLAAGRRAGKWLMAVQDQDGSWTSMAYHRGQACTYHTRVAAALLELAELAGEPCFRDVAIRNLRWVACRQQGNGFFLNSELIPAADPVLHTMIYVLEGFLMAYQLTGEQEWLDVVLRAAGPLKQINLERDLVLRSQYDANLNVSNPEKCIPGLAQWAGVCLALYELTHDAGYLEAATLTIYYLKSKQLRSKGALYGALPASVPLWGYYHPWTFPNWAVKFFADALMVYAKHGVEVWQEQETWVRKCFELQLDGGAWKRAAGSFDSFDVLICEKMEKRLRASGSNGLSFLDVGCGEGRYVKQLKQRNPIWHVAGVDPLAAGEPGDIRAGSATRLPFDNEAFDVAFAGQVLQHLAEPGLALGEIRRVLKPGSTLFIFDRDLRSGLGAVKPYKELRGRWMYPWDSPFRERWYTASQWRRLLSRHGFELLSCEHLPGAADRGWRRLANKNGTLLIAARRIG
jgi:ubiquinone/menaquinone biosynthesis C-methylase UbiE